MNLITETIKFLISFQNPGPKKLVYVFEMNWAKYQKLTHKNW